MSDEGSTGVIEALSIMTGIGLLLGLTPAALYGLKAFLIAFVFGAYVGFAALPSIDDKLWKPRPFCCSAFGSIGAFWFMSGLDQEWSIAIYILATCSAAVIGYFAPRWAINAF